MEVVNKSSTAAGTLNSWSLNVARNEPDEYRVVQQSFGSLTINSTADATNAVTVLDNDTNLTINLGDGNDKVFVARQGDANVTVAWAPATRSRSARPLFKSGLALARATTNE